MNGSHISLFAGVGMTDFAVERAGFKTVATAEIDPFCRSVLEVRYPSASHFDDVRKVTANDLGTCRAQVYRPLLISGGFPCQDISAPGTGHGLDGLRSGLWSEFRRVICDFLPEYVLIENSPLLRKRGLNRVLTDLAYAGYDAKWDCIPAAAFGAPHLRDRLFVTARPTTPTVEAYSSDRRIGDVRNGSLFHVRGEHHGLLLTELPRAGHMASKGVFSDTPRWPTNGLRKRTKWPTPTKSDGSGGPGTSGRQGGKNLRTAVAEVEGNGRLNPAWVEWLMGLPRGWTDPKLSNEALRPHMGWDRDLLARTSSMGESNRAKRIRALGNGLVPQAASAALDMGAILV